MKWLVPKFDYSAGNYTGTYRDLDDVDFFVDSDLGNDSTGDGSSTNPYKTISKVKSLGAGSWVAGTVIMVNGIFTENLTLDVAVRIVGAGGGYNGRAIFNSGAVRITVGNNVEITLDNIFLLNYAVNQYFLNQNTTTATNNYFSNCNFNTCGFNNYGSYNSARPANHYAYFCVYSAIDIYINQTPYTHGRISVLGNNNTFFNCTSAKSTGSYATYGLMIFVGNNNHMNNTLYYSNSGSNNLLNTDARYFTDNTEVTIAELYFSPANNNWNFPKTVSIWDKTAGATITTHPLYRTGTYNVIEGLNNHIGAGAEGEDLDATDDELNDDQDAIYQNLTKDGVEIYREVGGNDGILTSGTIDLGYIRSRVVISLNNSFAFDGGKMTRLIQETKTFTDRQGFDMVIQYGATTASLATCPELLIEYGKPISVSGAGANRKGNADPNFDPDSWWYPSMRYLIIKPRFISKS